MPLGPPNMAVTVFRFSTPGTRRAFGAWVTNGDGFPVPGAPTDTPGFGHFFPAGGDQLARFSLQDVAGLYIVRTVLEMQTAQREDGLPADQWLVFVRGVVREFEAVAARPWVEGPPGATTWTEAVLQEVKPS